MVLPFKYSTCVEINLITGHTWHGSRKVAIEMVRTAASFRNVSVKRGKNLIIQDLNLEISAGRIIGLLGPSGAGKSTLMRAMVGVQKGVKGSVEILGISAGAKALLRKVSYATQASSVFDDLTIEQNLSYTCSILGAQKSEVARVIADVQLGGYEDRKVGNLSGGQRSRVSLAMAMIGNPDVLILDEPTVGLDPVLRADLWEIFRSLADSGKTVFVSSHVMDEAERCDQIVFVRNGKVIASDSLERILQNTGTNSAEDAFLKLAREN